MNAAEFAKELEAYFNAEGLILSVNPDCSDEALDIIALAHALCGGADGELCDAFTYIWLDTAAMALARSDKDAAAKVVKVRADEIAEQATGSWLLSNRHRLAAAGEAAGDDSNPCALTATAAAMRSEAESVLCFLVDELEA